MVWAGALLLWALTGEYGVPGLAIGIALICAFCVARDWLI